MSRYFVDNFYTYEDTGGDIWHVKSRISLAQEICKGQRCIKQESILLTAQDYMSPVKPEDIVFEEDYKIDTRELKNKPTLKSELIEVHELASYYKEDREARFEDEGQTRGQSILRDYIDNALLTEYAGVLSREVSRPILRDYQRVCLGEPGQIIEYDPY